MKRILAIILVLVSANIIAQQVRDLEDFNSLKTGNAFEVELTQSDINQIIVSGVSEEDYEKIKTEVSNGELNIYSKGKIKSENGIKISLQFKSLNKIDCSGAAEVKTTNTINTAELSIVGSGASSMDFTLNVKKLNTEFSGASDIKLRGNTDEFNLKLSGASGLKAGDLIAKNVVIDVSGAADVKVYASESISGKATGASSINVKGNPATRNINNNGASTANFGTGDINVTIGKKVVDIDDDEVNVGTGKHKVSVNKDTTTISWGNTKLIIIDDSVYVAKKKKTRRNHWAGVDLGINGFFDANGSLDLSNPANFSQTRPQQVTQFMELNYRKSWTVSVNFLEFFIPVKEHHFGIVTGLGTEWNNYELKHNVRLNPDGGSFVYPNTDEYSQSYTWGEIDTVFNYSKNRFKTWFVNAPLLLEINTGDNADKSFHLSAGAILGYNLQTKMKYKYNENGEDKKYKDKDDFNTNPFRVSLTARAGIGRFNVFATYALTPLFENGRGPELYPFTVGVTLLGF